MHTHRTLGQRIGEPQEAKCITAGYTKYVTNTTNKLIEGFKACLVTQLLLSFSPHPFPSLPPSIFFSFSVSKLSLLSLLFSFLPFPIPFITFLTNFEKKTSFALPNLELRELLYIFTGILIVPSLYVLLK